MWTTELGIVGLTISALVSLLAYIIITNNKIQHKFLVTFDDSLKDLHKTHREERHEWREDAARRESESNQTLKELTDTINDFKEYLKLNIVYEERK